MTPFPLGVRSLFAGLPDEPSHEATRPPNWAATFTPSIHQGALDPARAIVIGDRGTGKSFWASVLADDGMRRRVSVRYPGLGLDRVVSALGFSSNPTTLRHPTASVIARIGTDTERLESLWRAVVLRLSPHPPAALAGEAIDWTQAAAWVADDPALRAAELLALDARLLESGQVYVLVFDALDLLGERWSDIRARMRGLIRLALAVRPLRAVRVKLFLRPDMAEDQTMWAVGDASKLRHNEVELLWRRRDLYGLLWTLLGNPERPEAGAQFRDYCRTLIGTAFKNEDGTWRPPLGLVADEAEQEKVFHALAGEWMGRDRRRGNTFTWVTNHLADAAGYAAPRSFLLAMRGAAQSARSTEFVLDRSGIEDGVRRASKVRVDELSEDYRWMGTVLEALKGLTVPIEKMQLISRWQERDTLATLRTLAEHEAQDHRFIPPEGVLDARNDELAYRSLTDVMVRLRIFLELADDRINIPDLFRLRADIKRRGGMKPRG
ncbi:MAG: hypothetical protein HIU82_18090 [Proteobacteria bacterium]|nr:hypothetical protein [Pseudomonadota bacterium]